MSDINNWPYPDIDIMFKEGDSSWREVSEEIYFDQLEVVHPVFMEGNAFVVGEPWDHDKRGIIHAVFVQVGDRYFCRNDHLIDFQPAIYIRQIRKQFNLKR